MKRVVCLVLSVALLGLSLVANVVAINVDNATLAPLATDINSFTTRINGVFIPFSDAQPGDTSVGYYVSEYGHGSGWECHAFALYAYDTIWEEQGYRDREGWSINSVAEAKAFIAGIYPGTLIQGRPDHSMIYLGTDDTGIIVYHSNWSGDNEISITHFTWNQFNDRFSSISSVFVPHKIDTWESVSSTKHSGYCLVCDADHIGNHIAETAGTGTCLLCGYYGNMSGLQNTNDEEWR